MRNLLRFDLRPLILAALAVAFYSAYVQLAPYHFDTALYLQSVRDAASSGHLVHPFPTRPLDTYVYWIADRLWGARGPAVASVLAIGLFAAAYYAAVRRYFGRAVGAASALLVLFTPATLVTVTHLKEDFWALLMLAVALILSASRGWLAALAAGIAFGLSLLFKEVPIFALPLLLATLALSNVAAAEWRDLARDASWGRAARPLLAFVAGLAVTVLAIAPRQAQSLLDLTASYHTGQFLGPWSSLQAQGIQYWREGMLHLVWPHLLIFVSLAAAFMAPRTSGGEDAGGAPARRLTPLLWFLTGAAIWVFLTNMTVMRGRLFVATAFFWAPLMVDGARAVIEGAMRGRARPAAAKPPARGKGRAGARAAAERATPKTAPAPARAAAVEAMLVVGALLLGLAHFFVVAPTLEYRRAYPPQAEFYGGLEKVLPRDALLLSFDDAVLARYFTGRECLAHPIDPDTAAYGRFAAELRARLARQPVFMLHDFMAYDRGGVLRERVPRDFRLTPVYTAYGEDYHDMTYCPRMDDLLLGMRARLGDCTIAGAGRKPLRLGAKLTVDEASYELRCKGEAQPVTVLEYQGVRTALVERTVYRVE